MPERWPILYRRRLRHAANVFCIEPVVLGCTMLVMSSSKDTPLRVCWLGQAEYNDTARLQRALRAAREAKAIDDVLLLLEHEPVITCGTRTEASEVAYARTKDIPIVAVERGGKATYHGPGQVVAYPIFDVSVVDGDVKQLVWRLEQAIIDCLSEYEIACTRQEGLPGVWCATNSSIPRKIASVGLRLTRGVTFHGIAINVANEMEPFTWFTPCGIADVQMTSLAQELNEDLPTASAEGRKLTTSVAATLERQISTRFGTPSSVIDRAELELVAEQFPVADPVRLLPWERAQQPEIQLPTASTSMVEERIQKV